jgi:hypothetical protein
MRRPLGIGWLFRPRMPHGHQAGELPFKAGANDAEAGSFRSQPPNRAARELVYNVFPALCRCRDALQASVQARNAAAANITDAALQRCTDEAKSAHAFHHAYLDMINIQHGFVQPPKRRSN